jgi:glycosyltransferase involved in cell wall biosynthesis
MRSLHVITSDARRGAETFAVGLCAALASDDHQAQVVALARSGDPRSLDVPLLGPSRGSPRTLAALRRAARTADVVVAHGSATLDACAVALAGTDVPFVYRNIGDPSYWAVAGWRRRRVGLMLRRAARVAALWPDAARRIAAMHGIPLDRIDVIPNAVSEERFALAGADERRRIRADLGVPDAAPCLAIVGALSPEKDVLAAIAAVAAVGDATLLIAGSGVLEAQLRQQADALARGRVRFLGQVDDPRQVYAAGDLLLLPSRSEGMPAVLVEAGLVGTATVATAVGAVPDMIRDDVTGFLSGPPDRVRFVARVLEALPGATEVGARSATAFRGAYAMPRVARLWTHTLQLAWRP